jgi:hypothetical protein
MSQANPKVLYCKHQQYWQYLKRVVRQDDLREATRKAAENAQHKKQTRLSPGEKKNRKRMAQVASVYDVQPHIRSAEYIMDHQEVESSDLIKRPKPKNKRVWASIEKEAGMSSQRCLQRLIGVTLTKKSNGLH